MNKNDIIDFREAILKWYDRHRRVLPWRALPGQTPDPYHVWLSEIMLQQTTVPAVIPYFLKFLNKWPDVKSLAAADPQDIMNEWAGLGYYARARNLLKCAITITNNHNGEFPQTQTELKKLPGIGDYTSAAITSIAFNNPATVVDGNVERVMARYFHITEKLPQSKPTLKSLAHDLSNNQTHRPGDYAQALMDLGATICTPKSPLCSLCPINQTCQGYKHGRPETLPARAEKTSKPKKSGYVYIIKNNQSEILLHKRPAKGLLGGMLGLPTTDWTPEKPEHVDFLQAAEINREAIHHSFTHFDLTLTICTMTKANITPPSNDYIWQPIENFESKTLPTVFRKAFVLNQKQ